MLLTPDRALALAPDAAAARAGAALAAARKWAALGGDGSAAWGECQGSGAQPYRTAVAFPDLAARCTCPSRKFPCKHALGLLLLLAAEPELFGVAEAPAWVAEWLAGRAARAEKQDRQRAAGAQGDAPNDTFNDTPNDAEHAAADAARATARTRRAAARADKAAAGLAELARWIEDLVRAGLAAAPSRPANFWEAAAARLVDAQLPGAARLVRQLGVLPTTGAGWPERLVAAVARLHLLARAYPRLAALPADARADVRAALGLPPDDAAPIPVADRWTVLGHAVELEDRLRVRRTWLAGRATGRHALLLHFAHGDAPFAEAVPPAGGVLDAELAFAAGSAPLRAAVHARRVGAGDDAPPLPAGHARLTDATRAWADAVAANPWTERVALVLDAAVPEPRGDGWLVRDCAGDAVPVAPRFRAVWPLLALAGGRPVWMAGEWDGDALFPLAAAGADGAVVSLTGPFEAAR